MELLIRAIIWLFKNLFGDQEPPAHVGPRRDESYLPDKKGPYDYGDDRPVSGERQKTLAELLEEARRQSAEGRLSDNRQPSAPPAKSPSPAPVTRAQTSPVEQQSLTEPFVGRVKRTRDKKRKTSPQPEDTTKTPLSSLDPEHAKNSHGFRTEDLGLQGFQKEEHDMQSFQKMDENSEKVFNSGDRIPLFIQSIRTATREEKARTCAEAWIVHEILGPPRCRRSFPGTRS